jgi:hypothetical protein
MSAVRGISFWNLTGLLWSLCVAATAWLEMLVRRALVVMGRIAAR